MDRTELSYGEDAAFMITYPGAEALMAHISYDKGYGADYNRINAFEDTTGWTVTGDWSTGSRTYAFAALVEGRWSEWSDPITLTVAESPSQQLPQPVINVPASIQRGQDLAVSIEADGADYGYLYLYDAQGTQHFQRNINGGSSQVEIPGYRLPVGTAKLSVTVYGQNGRNNAETTVDVTAGTQPTRPEIAPLSRTETAGNPFSFDIPAEEADRLAVRYYRSGNSNDVYYNDFEADGDSTAWTDGDRYTPGEVWKYAFARRVNSVWSGWSAICTVTIAQREVLQPVVLNVPESLSAGMDLTVSFSDPDNGDRATNYELRITRSDGKNTNYWDAQPGRVYRLDGLDLAEGDYTVRVTAYASLYDSSEQTATIPVTGPRAEAPNVTLFVPDPIYSGDSFSFRIENVGGERIAWRSWLNDKAYDSGRLTVREDDTLWETSAGAGVWKYSFALQKDGAWSEWSAPIEVTVEPRQATDLAAPQVQALPDQIPRNKDLVVSITGPAEAQRFYIELLNADGETLDSMTLYGPGDATFLAYEEALPLGEVRVRVYDYGSNGSRNQAEDMILQVVAGTPGEAPQVTPPAQTEVEAGGSFTFNVTAEGADMAVARWYRVGNPNRLYYAEFDMNDTGEGTWTKSTYSFGTGTYRVSFAVRIDGAWSRWTSFSGIEVVG